MPSAHPLTDHDQIRRWAEERRATPACVKGTGGRGDTGMIRLDFPGFSGANKLQPISWTQWFRSFDENNLALLVQDTTARGQRSNFNKLVARKTAEGRQKSRRAGRRTAAGRTRGRASRRSTKRAGAKRAAGRAPAPRSAAKRGNPHVPAQAASRRGHVPWPAGNRRGRARPGAAPRIHAAAAGVPGAAPGTIDDAVKPASTRRPTFSAGGP
jgi:hypothetical protein